MTDMMTDMIREAERANRQREAMKGTEHLPDTFEDAVPVAMEIVRDYDACCREGRDDDIVLDCLNRMAKLITKLQGGTMFGCMAPEGMGSRLAVATAAEPGTVPMWGQRGTFVLTVAGYKVGVEWPFIKDIAGHSLHGSGFALHEVDGPMRPWTTSKYRSVLGVFVSPKEGEGPDAYVERVLLKIGDKDKMGTML